MSESKPEYESEARSGGAPAPAPWDAGRVRLLRGHIGATQREFAERLGTRQQTVSEWETGASSPRAMAGRLLHLVAEEGGFYSAEVRSPAAEDHVTAREDAEGAATSEREPAPEGLDG